MERVARRPRLGADVGGRSTYGTAYGQPQTIDMDHYTGGPARIRMAIPKTLARIANNLATLTAVSDTFRSLDWLDILSLKVRLQRAAAAELTRR